MFFDNINLIIIDTKKQIILIKHSEIQSNKIRDKNFNNNFIIKN